MAEINIYRHQVGPARVICGCAPEISPPPGRKVLRKIQQEVKNQLLKEEGLEDKVLYDERGRPYLTGGRHISISHSGLCAALALAPVPVGLDIQMPDSRLIKIKDKFLAPTEKLLNPIIADLDTLLKIWTAKEAVYKALGIPGLSFSNHLLISGTISDTGRATVFLPGKYLRLPLHWWRCESLTACLTYIS